MRESDRHAGLCVKALCTIVSSAFHDQGGWTYADCGNFDSIAVILNTKNYHRPESWLCAVKNSSLDSTNACAYSRGKDAVHFDA
jgi:hypothetical protein